jgi:NAD(P)-dependent dehydrogenase (short-subunit alcohol dehydrogenase family)
MASGRNGDLNRRTAIVYVARCRRRRRGSRNPGVVIVAMRERGFGRIVNISSINGQKG